MSKKHYESKGLWKPAVLLPKEGITYPITGKDWRCSIGRHDEIHLAGVPSGECTVVCKRCGEILWQHQLERFPE